LQHNLILWSYQQLDFSGTLYVHLSVGGVSELTLFHVVILYLTALAVRAYHRHHLMVDPTISNSHLVTEETTVSTRHSDSTRPSLLPITDTSRAPISLHFLQEDYRKTLNTRSNSVSIPPRYSLSPATPSLNVNPGRLSKRSPLIDHV